MSVLSLRRRLLSLTPLSFSSFHNENHIKSNLSFSFASSFICIFLKHFVPISTQKNSTSFSPSESFSENSILDSWRVENQILCPDLVSLLGNTKAEKARACIPKEFKLVELFGYTLGGFFLANYEDSPAGVFDELVVLAGIVWNRPTSCAWAAQVYVSSDRVCDHGRKFVGLPSQVARFSKRIAAVSRKSGLLDTMGIHASSCSRMEDVQVTEIKSPDLWNISLASAVPALNVKQWMGPTIKMSLPSFSGATEYNPNLLKYSCRIECRVRAVQPFRVSEANPTIANDDKTEDIGNVKNDNHNISTFVMLSKPILSLKFSEMKMQVDAPIVLPQTSSATL